jgi:hypothetical protein
LFERLLKKKKPPFDGKIENPRLLKAIQEVALKDTPENRKKLYTEFLNATLIFPTPEITGKPGLQIAAEQTTFQITGITNANGVAVTPAFTDYEALWNWDPNTPSVAMQAKDYFGMLVPLSFQEVLINPSDSRRKMIRPGGRVTRREFEALAKGELPQAKPAIQTVYHRAGTKLRFRKAEREFPDDAMKRIAEVLNKFEDVQGAFILIIAYGNEQPHRAIAVRLAMPLSEERQRLLAKLVLEIVRPLLQEKEAFDLIPMSANFYQEVVRTIPPFYDRALK